MSGTLVCDDPTTDREDDFGLITDNLYIPFDAAGATVHFESFAPSCDEVNEHRHQIIGPDEWNPSTVNLQDSPSRDNRAIEIAALRTERDVPLGGLSFDSKPVELVEDKYEPHIVLSSVSTVLDKKSFDRALLSKVVTEKRHTPVNAEELSQKFAIGLDTAKRTLQVTTQRGIRHAIHPIHRRYRVDHLHLHVNRLKGPWFMDSLVARHKSLHGNRYLHTIMNGKYTRAFPVKDKTSLAATGALDDFVDDVGIPETLWVDGAKEYVGRNTEFKKACRKYRIDLRMTEPGQKNQNHAAEREIGELKRRWRRRRAKKNASHQLWDYGMVYETELMNRYSRGPDGRTGYEEVTGNTPDISEWCDFEWYDLVWYRPHGKLTDADKAYELALWIGVSHRVGSDMSYWLLPKSGVVGSYTTVQHVTQEDHANPQHREDIETFLATIKE